MRVPISWLGRHVALDGVSPDALSEQLTIAGSEIEHIDALGALHHAVVVGVIAQAAVVNEAVRAFQVDVGDRTLSVVSKAPNLLDAGPGVRIAVALPGAQVFTRKPDGALALMLVQQRETYGHPSEAVGCSPFELGLGDDHAGVMVLGDAIAAGTPVADVVTVPEDAAADRVLTIAILPNIARCQSVLGVAREVGAIRSAPAALDVAERALDFDPGSDLSPSAADPALCDRFATALVEGVVVAPSPAWVQRRLVAAGQQPINNVVDASNYVMLELGQPTHAYDADALPSLKLHVRASGPDEVFKPLVADDDADPTPLPDGLPLITSGDVPVAQAGVMGGFETQVSAGTTRLLLESAHFDPIAVRRSQAATLTFSESSARFSRGTDPAGCERAIRRILAVLGETCPDLVVRGAGLWAPTALTEPVLQLKVTALNAALGMSFTEDRVVELLERAAFTVAREKAGDTLHVTVPTSRQDVEGPHDLVEEVARLEGFDAMPSTMPVEPVPQRPQPRAVVLRRAVEDTLVAAGLQQTLSYSLTSPEVEDRLFAGTAAPPERAYTTLLNPISEDRRVMRRTLLGHLVEHVRDNLRHSPSAHLFEVGPVVHPEASTDPDGLPAEPMKVAVIMAGPVAPAGLHAGPARDADLFDLAAAIEGLLSHFHVGELGRVAASAAPFHPGICAAVTVRAPDDPAPVVLGHMGELHPAVATAFDLDGRRVFAAELDLQPILDRATVDFHAPGPARFPGIDLDISLLVATDVPAAALVDAARSAGGPLLRTVTVFDLYAGKGIAEGERSLGLRLHVADPTRTLRMEEGEAERDAIVAALGERFGARLRG